MKLVNTVMKNLRLTHNFGLMKLLLITAFSVAVPIMVSAQNLPELDCVIEPSEIVDVGSASAGVLEVVGYDRGDFVQKNAVIAKLESGTEKASAELARIRSSFDTGIQLRQTSADFFDRNRDRSRSLTQRSAISKQQLDQLDTEASVAKLQVRQEQDNRQIAKLEYRRAQQALKRRSIRSPIEGVVMERFKSVGEYVEDTAVMRVAKLNPLHVETIVPVSHMGKIKPGMQAQITPEVPGQDAEYAYVTRVDRVADAASGTFGVRLRLDNPEGDIVTGVRCLLQFDDKRPVVKLDKSQSPKKVSVHESNRAPDNKKEPEQQLTDLSVDDAALGQCFKTGPLARQATADALVEQLKTAGHNANALKVPGKYPGQSLVLTPRFESRQAAVAALQKMRDKNVGDMDLITKGSRAQRISLGLYNSERSAKRRFDELTALGFSVQIEPRSANAWWIDIASARAVGVNDLRRELAPNSPERVKAVPCASLQAFAQ